MASEFNVKQEKWIFELYIAGMNPNTITTLENLKQFCKIFLQAEYEITIVDLTEQPLLAREKQIFAIPTLIKISPEPECRSIGDLSNTDSLRRQLNLFNTTPITSLKDA